MHDQKHDPMKGPGIVLRRAAPDDAPMVSGVFLASFKATYDFPLAHTDEEVRGWIRDDLIPAKETWVAVAPRQETCCSAPPPRPAAGIASVT